VVKENKLLDAKKLISEGIIIIRRDSNQDVVPFKKVVDKVTNEEIYIRYGQLDSNNKINGIGTKITLRPKYYSGKIFEFIENGTFIEQGEFNNDELDRTFGRKILIKGTAKFGWFVSGSNLHGFGLDTELRKPAGLFENGEYKQKSIEIQLYDYEIDFIAKSIELE